MSDQIATAGDFVALVVLHNLASSITIEDANTITIINTIKKFRAELEQSIESCQPAWSRTDITHSQIVWPADAHYLNQITRVLQKIERLRKKAAKWLYEEGFLEFKLSVGMETGIIILTGREALGIPIATAYMLADFGLAKSSIVASKNTISLLEFDLNNPSEFFDIEIKGLSGNPRKVALLPNDEFDY